MNINAIRQLYSQHKFGWHPALHVLSKPAKPKHQPNLYEHDTDIIDSLTSAAQKHHEAPCLLLGEADQCKAYIANQLSIRLAHPVCFVQSGLLIESSGDELGKVLCRLLAEASTQHWILLFAEADKLLTASIDADSQVSIEQQKALMLKRLLMFAGVVLLSLNNERLAQQIDMRVKYTIHAH